MEAALLKVLLLSEFFILALCNISCDDIKTIVNTHNIFRWEVAKGQLSGQPKASNMQMLAWSEELARHAQRHSERHTTNHSKRGELEREAGSKFTSYGESLSYMWDLPADRPSNWAETVKNWFKEHSNYQYQPSNHKAPNFNYIGHYTQVVWADTKYVGCGRSSEKAGSTYKIYEVCNYGNGGNMDGQYPYEIGNGCENLCCEEQCNKLYGNQCE